MIRVILVDDSPLALTILQRMLALSAQIEVVGTANNGLEALEMIPRLKPDVVCTDLHMPKMDGLSLVRELMGHHPVPILVVSISVQKEAGDDQNIFALLEAGAIDVYPKPSIGMGDATDTMSSELIQKIRILSGVVPVRRHGATRKAQARMLSEAKQTPDPPAPRPAWLAPLLSTSLVVDTAPVRLPTNLEVIAIGASTGGPQALSTILSALPARFQTPILCVQHISAGFLEEMVRWLNSHTLMQVQIARAGESPLPGRVYFPPEDSHLTLDSRRRFLVTQEDVKHHHRPAVDVLFQGIAQHCGPRSLGILLTGMGSDGAEGLLAMAKSGALTIAQDEESCVVFGMPKQAIQLGAARHVLSIQQIADTLANAIG